MGPTAVMVWWGAVPQSFLLSPQWRVLTAHMQDPNSSETRPRNSTDASPNSSGGSSGIVVTLRDFVSPGLIPSGPAITSTTLQNGGDHTQEEAFPNALLDRQNLQVHHTLP